jgi:hypothetical protein
MGKAKIFIIKLFVFTLLFIILDFAIGSALEHFYFSRKSQSSGDNKLYYSLNMTAENILIFGASTAIHEYIPRIVEDSLGITCYNTGWNGTNIYFSYTILNSALKRYTPKVVIFDMTAWELVKFEDDFDKLSELYPYYYSNKSVKEIIDFSGKYEKYKMLSKTYRYNSKLLFILTQNISTQTVGDKGYEPIYGRWENNLVEDTLSVAPYDSIKFSYFDKFVTHAREKGSKVVIVSPPVFRLYTKDQFSVIMQYCQKRNVKFWNFRNDTVFINHRKYFYDYVHLNHTGAELFTKQIADSLKILLDS